MCNVNSDSKKKDRHHVLFEKKLIHSNKNVSQWYTSSWKRSLTIPLCRGCHDLYHKLYKEPTGGIEKLIYGLPPQIVQFTIEYVNTNKIQDIIDDAIASSHLISLVDRNLCGEDYFRTCEYYHVSYGDLYQKLLPMLPPALAEISMIEAHLERIPKKTFVWPPIKQNDAIDKYVLQYLNLARTRSSEGAIVKYVKIKLKNPKGLRNTTVIKRLDYLCETGTMSKEYDEIKKKTFYRRIHV